MILSLSSDEFCKVPQRLRSIKDLWARWLACMQGGIALAFPGSTEVNCTYILHNPDSLLGLCDKFILSLLYFFLSFRIQLAVAKLIGAG